MSFTPPQFDVEQKDLDERTRVIRVTGEIHATTAPALAAPLDDAVRHGKTLMVLDLTAVEFIDSTGLSVLLNGLRQVTRVRGRMALACTNPTVLRLFEITRLDATFDILPSCDEALARVRQDAAD